MADVKGIAKFLKNSVEELIKIDEGCCEFKLDDDLSLFVGWSGGYDNAEDTTIIQSKNDPEFAINAGIKSNHEYMKTDFDWLNYPYEEESGEVWDSGITISPNEDYEKDAQWFLDQYAEIRAALDKGEIVLENKKIEESKENISFREIEDMMDNAEDYSELYEAASYIEDTGLRIDVENLIGVCEDDEDEIDQAVSIICSDLLDMYINDENVSNLREGKKVTEGNETEIEDLATVMYSEIMEWATPDRDGKITDFEVNDLEDYQDWYDSSVTPEIYNAAKTNVENALNNVKFYEGDRGEPYIELNDNRTLWDIEAPDKYDADEDGSFEIAYSDMVQEACQDFKDETGEELYLLGRMGRHACVVNSYVNAIRYNELKAAQEKYEKQVIDKANAFLKGELDENKKVTEARRNPLGKVGDTTVREYGRDLQYPEEVYLAQSIFEKYCDDGYYGDNNYIGNLLAMYLWSMTVNGEDYTLAEVFRDNEYVAEWLKGKYSEIGKMSQEELANISLEDYLTEDDVENMINIDLEDLLYDVPIELTVKYSSVSSGIEIVGIRYTGNDNEKREAVEELNKNKDISSILGYEGGQTDRKETTKRNNEDSLSDNNKNHRYLAQYKEKVKEIQDRITNLEAKLKKSKNYNASVKIQKEIDSLKQDLERYTKFVNEKLRSIKGESKKVTEGNKEKKTESKGDYSEMLSFATQLASALKSKGFQVKVNGEDNYVNINPKRNGAEMGVAVYLGEDDGQYGFEANTVGLGGDTISDETIYPLYAAGWDYETATPSGKQPEVGSVTYAIFKETANTTIDEVVNVIENSFNGTELEESKKLEEKDTKKEFQDYCNDLGLDPNKKSSINKFIKDYAENYVTLKGTKDFTAEIDRIKKELKESISKKVESKDVKTALTELNVSTFDELKEQLEDLYGKGLIDDGAFDAFDSIVSDQEDKCEDYINRRSKVTNTDDNDLLGIEADYVTSTIQKIISCIED